MTYMPRVHPWEGRGRGRGGGSTWLAPGRAAEAASSRSHSARHSSGSGAAAGHGAVQWAVSPACEAAREGRGGRRVTRASRGNGARDVCPVSHLVRCHEPRRRPAGAPASLCTFGGREETVPTPSPPAGAPADHGCVQDGGLLAVAGPDGGVAIGRVGRPRARALEAPLVGGKLLPERPAAAEVKLRHDVPRAADAGGEGGAGAAKLPLLPDGARRERLVGGGQLLEPAAELGGGEARLPTDRRGELR